jgi:hypothetical protein
MKIESTTGHVDIFSRAKENNHASTDQGLEAVFKGRPKRGRTFSDALHARGTANELAELAWKAAREGQPWAIQMITSGSNRSRRS